jgi:hypothetical protein
MIEMKNKNDNPILTCLGALGIIGALFLHFRHRSAREDSQEAFIHAPMLVASAATSNPQHRVAFGIVVKEVGNDFIRFALRNDAGRPAYSYEHAKAVFECQREDGSTITVEQRINDQQALPPGLGVDRIITIPLSVRIKAKFMSGNVAVEPDTVATDGVWYPTTRPRPEK